MKPTIRVARLQRCCGIQRRLWTAGRAGSSLALLLFLVLVAGQDALAQSGGGLLDVGGSTSEVLDESQEVKSELVQDVEDALGVYIVHPPLREPLERVVIEGDTAEVWFLRDLSLGTEEAICDAYRWLFSGRFGNNKGVLSLFQKRPEIQNVKLIFYTVQTGVRVTYRAEYAQNRTPVRELELNVSKSRGLTVDAKSLEKVFKEARGASCVAAGESLVDSHWYIQR